MRNSGVYDQLHNHLESELNDLDNRAAFAALLLSLYKYRIVRGLRSQELLKLQMQEPMTEDQLQTLSIGTLQRLLEWDLSLRKYVFATDDNLLDDKATRQFQAVINPVSAQELLNCKNSQAMLSTLQQAQHAFMLKLNAWQQLIQDVIDKRKQNQSWCEWGCGKLISALSILYHSSFVGIGAEIGQYCDTIFKLSRAYGYWLFMGIGAGVSYYIGYPFILKTMAISQMALLVDRHLGPRPCNVSASLYHPTRFSYRINRDLSYKSIILLSYVGQTVYTWNYYYLINAVSSMLGSVAVSEIVNRNIAELTEPTQEVTKLRERKLIIFGLTVIGMQLGDFLATIGLNGFTNMKLQRYFLSYLQEQCDLRTDLSNATVSDSHAVAFSRTEIRINKYEEQRMSSIYFWWQRGTGVEFELIDDEGVKDVVQCNLTLSDGDYYMARCKSFGIVKDVSQ